jgi:formyl-CoA transferase
VDLFTAGGRADLVDDPVLASRATRTAAIDDLYQQVAAVLLTRPTAEWLEFCDTHDIPAGPVATLEQLVAELPIAEHPVAGQYRVIPAGVRFDATPTSVRRHAALIGEHGDEVLLEAGYSAADVAGLRESGALRSTT